jgi:hypothetical protein
MSCLGAKSSPEEAEKGAGDGDLHARAVDAGCHVAEVGLFAPLAELVEAHELLVLAAGELGEFLADGVQETLLIFLGPLLDLGDRGHIVALLGSLDLLPEQPESGDPAYLEELEEVGAGALVRPVVALGDAVEGVLDSDLRLGHDVLQSLLPFLFGDCPLAVLVHHVEELFSERRVAEAFAGLVELEAD